MLATPALLSAAPCLFLRAPLEIPIFETDVAIESCRSGRASDALLLATVRGLILGPRCFAEAVKRGPKTNVGVLATLAFVFAAILLLKICPVGSPRCKASIAIDRVVLRSAPFAFTLTTVFFLCYAPKLLGDAVELSW